MRDVYQPFAQAAEAAAAVEVWVDFGADCLWASRPDQAMVAVGDPVAMGSLNDNPAWVVQSYDAEANPINVLYDGPDQAAALAAFAAAL